MTTGFTQEKLDALENAIAEGVLKVKYQDKEVQYRSLDEMLRLRDLMRREMGLIGCGGGRKIGIFSSGL